jgi:hypothetical protein
LDKEYKHHLKKIENIFDFVSGSVMGNINQRDDKGHSYLVRLTPRVYQSPSKEKKIQKLTEV